VIPSLPERKEENGVILSDPERSEGESKDPRLKIVPAVRFTADSLAASSLTASSLTASSLTASSLAASSLTASSLTASSLTVFGGASRVRPCGQHPVDGQSPK
jgi:hypothetical protein